VFSAMWNVGVFLIVDDKTGSTTRLKGKYYRLVWGNPTDYIVVFSSTTHFQVC
jgi:hypothetical protein